MVNSDTNSDGIIRAVRKTRALSYHTLLVLKYRLKTVQAPLNLRSYTITGRTRPVSARDVAHYAAGGDLDRVWAARNDEQDARNKTRAEARVNTIGQNDNIREYAI